MPKKIVFNFEASLAELTQLLEKMEAGGLSLEGSMQCFEEGIALNQRCQEALSAAEQKVEILMQKAEGVCELLPFESKEENNIN